jgi:hypothetical protein
MQTTSIAPQPTAYTDRTVVRLTTKVTFLAEVAADIGNHLPDDRAPAWCGEFLGALGKRTKLALVWPRFAHWLLTAHEPRAMDREVAGLVAQVINHAAPSAATWQDAYRRTASNPLARAVIETFIYPDNPKFAKYPARFAASSYVNRAAQFYAGAEPYADFIRAASAHIRTEQADKLLELLRSAR